MSHKPESCFYDQNLRLLKVTPRPQTAPGAYDLRNNISETILLDTPILPHLVRHLNRYCHIFGGRPMALNIVGTFDAGLKSALDSESEG